MADYKVTDQELINVANAIGILLGDTSNRQSYKWTRDYLLKLSLVQNRIAAAINKIKTMGYANQIDQENYSIEVLVNEINKIANDFEELPYYQRLKNIVTILFDPNEFIETDIEPESYNTVSSFDEISEEDEWYYIIGNLGKWYRICTEEDVLNAQQDLDDLVLEVEENNTTASELIILFSELFEALNETQEALNEYRSGDYSIVQTTTRASGRFIFSAIETLEQARTPEEIVYAADKFVIYVAKVYHSDRQSFICCALKNGIIQNGSYFYTANSENGLNFYITSAPDYDAYLQQGSRLIRIVLEEEEA